MHLPMSPAMSKSESFRLIGNSPKTRRPIRDVIRYNHGRGQTGSKCYMTFSRTWANVTLSTRTPAGATRTAETVVYKTIYHQ